MKKRFGFTLIEILIVVAVISLLSTIAFLQTDDILARTRDRQRIQDLQTIASALEQYHNEYGQYPDNNASGFELSAIEGDNFLDVLDPFMPNGNVPIDPINQPCYYYTGNGTCDPDSSDWWYHQEYDYRDHDWNKEGTVASWTQCGTSDHYILWTRLESIRKGDPEYISCTCPFPISCHVRPYLDWNEVTEKWDVPVDCDDERFWATPGVPDSGVCGVTCPNDADLTYPDDEGFSCDDTGYAQFVECNQFEKFDMGGTAASICGFGRNDCDLGEC